MTTAGRPTCPTCGGPWNGDSERFRVTLQPRWLDGREKAYVIGEQGPELVRSRDLATVLETVPSEACE